MNARGDGARHPPTDGERLRLLAGGIVSAEPGRCVQCGICTWSCPMGVDTRRYARAGQPVTDPACILCGTCITRCPRGTLHFEWPLAPATESVEQTGPEQAA